jgi:fibronectin-binding autotransporter adhesin
MCRIMEKSPPGFEIARYTYRSIAVAICSAALSLSALTAADIDVTRVDDSGAGSLRQGLSNAQSGDRLNFNSILNGTTLLNGTPLTLNNAVTFLDTTGINVIDNHAYLLAPPVSVPAVPPATTPTTAPAPLTINWKGTLTLNGYLSDTTTGGAVIMSGPGTLVLSNTNSYTGGTTINGGTIQISNSSALGTGALTVGTVAGTKTLSLGNSLNVANTITLSSALTVNSAAGTTNLLSGIISGTAATDTLNTTGTGTLRLSGVNTFAGGVHVENDSTLRLENNAGLGTGTLTVAGALKLDLASGLGVTTVKNNISLGNSLTANIDSGTATLSGAITETTPSQFTKSGAGTLILSGTNTFTGGIINSQGTLQGDSSSLVGNITNNSSLIFNQGGSGTYAGNITGTGHLTKAGNGTLNFSGTSSLLSTTMVNSGDLQVTGSMTGPVNVNSSAAALSGTGSIGSVTNNGFVQPGTPTGIGSLKVNGDFTQQSGGTTEIKINSAGNAAGINNDQINITGKAKLGGVLDVIALTGGTYTPGTRYTILTATGGVTSPFAQASTNLSMFGVDVAYGANDVTFQLIQTSSLRAAAQTANQISVGTALDNIALSSTGGLFAMINNLGTQSPAQQRQTMNQMSGDAFGSLQTLGLQIGDQFQQRLTSTLVSNGKFLTGLPAWTSSNPNLRGQSPSPDGSLKGWFQGFGVGGNLRSDGNAAGVNYSQGGGIYGLDLEDEDNGRVGIVGGTSYLGFNDSYNAKGNITSYQVGTYGVKHDDTGYFLGSANYGFNSYITDRNVTGAGLPQLLHADYTGNQIGANGEAGLKLEMGIFRIQPLVGLQYLYLCQQGFRESGGAAGLDVARSRANSLRASVGARVLIDQWVGPNGAIWTPFSHARFVSDLLDNNRTINASFNGSPVGGAFTTQGTRIGQNYGIFGEGLEIRVNEAWSLFGGADVMLGNRITVATGSIGAVCFW